MPYSESPEDHVARRRLEAHAKLQGRHQQQRNTRHAISIRQRELRVNHGGGTKHQRVLESGCRVKRHEVRELIHEMNDLVLQGLSLSTPTLYRVLRTAA